GPDRGRPLRMRVIQLRRVDERVERQIPPLFQRLRDRQGDVHPGGVVLIEVILFEAVLIELVLGPPRPARRPLGVLITPFALEIAQQLPERRPPPLGGPPHPLRKSPVIDHLAHGSSVGTTAFPPRIRQTGYATVISESKRVRLSHAVMHPSGTTRCPAPSGDHGRRGGTPSMRRAMCAERTGTEGPKSRPRRRAGATGLVTVPWPPSHRPLR